MKRIKLILYWIFDQFIYPFVSSVVPYRTHARRAARIHARTVVKRCGSE